MGNYDLDKTKAFLVSQKALIIEDGRLLLLKETSHEKWELPGGLLELEEDLATGLKREVYEETGLDIVIGSPVSICDTWVPGFIYKDNRVLDTRIIVVTYLCTKLAGSLHLSQEHTDFIWVNRPDVLSLNLAPDCSLALHAYFAANRA